jgi:hypothetical protein
MATKEKVRKIVDDPVPADEDQQTAERVQEDEIVEEADGAVDDDEELPEAPPD